MGYENGKIESVEVSKKNLEDVEMKRKVCVERLVKSWKRAGRLLVGGREM